jgi:hypothetical protein
MPRDNPPVSAGKRVSVGIGVWRAGIAITVLACEPPVLNVAKTPHPKTPNAGPISEMGVGRFAG